MDIEPTITEQEECLLCGTPTKKALCNPCLIKNARMQDTVRLLLQMPEILTANILRTWDRKTIVRFAAHLLGEKCQECQFHQEGNSDEEVATD